MKIMTPHRQIISNILLRNLKCNYSFWKIYNRWFVFKDHHSSITTEVVYKEIQKGFYNLQSGLEPGDIVLDLGSHIGMFSIPLAKLYPSVYFYCFEPNPQNFKNLEKNIKLNKIKNIIAYNYAVGKEQIVQIQHNKLNTGASKTNQYNYENLLADIKYSWNLEQIYQHIGKLPKVIKCDIEGSEYDLFSSKESLKEINELLIEIHPSEKSAQLKKWVEESVPLNTICVVEQNYRNEKLLSI